MSQPSADKHHRHMRDLVGRRLPLLRGLLALAFAATPSLLRAQSPGQADPLSVSAKWQNFVHETVNPLTVLGGVFDATASQITNSSPKYGSGMEAFGQRVGAATAGIVTQNFFGDFMTASALHDDPRYFRKGPAYGKWHRLGYAISRSWIIRTDSGESTFNWPNVIGSAMSTGVSYAYYPSASRNGGSFTFEFVTSVFGTGFADIAHEFWPDVCRKLAHRR